MPRSPKEKSRKQGHLFSISWRLKMQKIELRQEYLINAKHNYEFLNAHFFLTFIITPAYLHTQLDFTPLQFENFSPLSSFLVFSTKRTFTSNQITFKVPWTKLPEVHTHIHTHTCTHMFLCVLQSEQCSFIRVDNAECFFLPGHQNSVPYLVCMETPKGNYWYSDVFLLLAFLP